jgi:hypothetical protein
MPLNDLGDNTASSRCFVLDREQAVEFSQLLRWLKVEQLVGAAGADSALCKSFLNFRRSPSSDTGQSFLLAGAKHW